MKVSEVTVTDLMDYARVEDDSDETVKLFTSILVAAKSFICNYTGLTTEQLDEKEDITIALYVLSTEMYENRVYTDSVQNNVNKVVAGILNMHSINLL